MPIGNQGFFGKDCAIKVNFWDMFPLTYFDLRLRTQYAAAKNVKKEFTLVQPYLEKFSLNRQPPPYHPALMNQVAGLRKYKFRSEMWNGSEVHMGVAKESALAEDSQDRIERRKDAERFAHFHHQDLMIEKELVRTHDLFVLKAFSRIANSKILYVGLMNRDAFMEHVRDKMISHWDEGQRSAQLAEYRIQGMSPGGIPLTTHNLAADSQAELLMLAKTKATIDPQPMNTIERLLASHAMQVATSLYAPASENPSANHMKSLNSQTQVSTVSKTKGSKAS